MSLISSTRPPHERYFEQHFLNNKKNVQHNLCQQYKQIKSATSTFCLKSNKFEKICISISKSFKINITFISNLSAKIL